MQPAGRIIPFWGLSVVQQRHWPVTIATHHAEPYGRSAQAFSAAVASKGRPAVLLVGCWGKIGRWGKIGPASRTGLRIGNKCSPISQQRKRRIVGTDAVTERKISIYMRSRFGIRFTQ